HRRRLTLQTSHRPNPARLRRQSRSARARGYRRVPFQFWFRLLIFVIPSEVEESLATFQEDREGGSKRCLGFVRHNKRTAVKKDLGDTPPQIFREQLHRLADWIAGYWGKKKTLRLGPDAKHGANRAALPAQPPEQGEPF